METDHQQNTMAVFPQKVTAALGQLKARLQQRYQKAYPGLDEIIRLVLEVEEANALKLSPFPHLLLPDLVEAHIADLDLRARVEHEHASVPHDVTELPVYRRAFFLCG